MVLYNFLVILLFIVYSSASEDLCTHENLESIQNCYEEQVFDKGIPDLETLFHQVLSMNVTNNRNSWEPLCEIKKNLNSCLGEDLIQKCFNLNDLKNLTILNGLSSTAMLSNFIDIDYSCSKFVYTNAFQCNEIFENELIQNCGILNFTQNYCPRSEKFIDCVENIVSLHCGKPYGCVVKKVSTLVRCFAKSGSNCGLCPKMSIKPDLLDSICSDDIINNGCIINFSLYGTVIVILSYFVLV